MIFSRGLARTVRRASVGTGKGRIRSTTSSQGSSSPLQEKARPNCSIPSEAGEKTTRSQLLSATIVPSGEMYRSPSTKPRPVSVSCHPRVSLASITGKSDRFRFSMEVKNSTRSWLFRLLTGNPLSACCKRRYWSAISPREIVIAFH